MDIYQPLIASSGHGAGKAKLQFYNKCPSVPRENHMSFDKTQADRCFGRLCVAVTGLAMIIGFLALLLYYIRDVPLRAASSCHSLRAYWR